MKRLLRPHFQRLLLRVLFAILVLLWASIGKLQAVGATSATLLVAVFAGYSFLVFLAERIWRADRSEIPVSGYLDMVFIGVLIAFSGGAQSEFHLLLYFVVALRAPYRSWGQTLLVPGVCTLVYLGAVGHVGREYHWFELVVRIGLLWFLAVVLRLTGLRSVREQERSRKMTRELSATHDEVRRYTAALEKTNAEKETRLTEITILHRFVTQARGLKEFDQVYDAMLPYMRSICELPWIYLLHSPVSEGIVPIVRILGDPPKEVTDWVRENGMMEGGDDSHRTKQEFEGIGEVDFRIFSRCTREHSPVSLVLCYPAGKWVILEGHIKLFSSLMDSLEMELELIRLRKDLGQTNLRLEESNRHLLRLQELQKTLTTAFLSDENISGVLHDAHQIMARELFELDRLNLFLPDPENGMLQCRTSVGIGDEPLEEIAVPVDERGGALALAFRTGRTIFFEGKGDVPQEYRLSEPYNRIAAIRSRIFVIVPLIDYAGNVLGVIGADRKHTQRPIPPETVTVLEYFAHHIAMVLSVQKLKTGAMV